MSEAASKARPAGPSATTAIVRKVPNRCIAKLEQTIVPMFYAQRSKYVEVMRHAIALNGSFFNTQRMVQQYIAEAYAPVSSL